VSIVTRPRVGFLGVGWIGRSRMQALLETGLVEPAGVADVDSELRTSAAADLQPAVATLDELLELDLAGLVIATPNSLHAEQAIAALERGIAVFCQKPLGRDGEETRRVIEAARDADRLLGVDLSYRYTRATQAVHAGIAELGQVYALDLVFHNAYGPDKPWFTQPRLSGGGCLIDLGTHLVDLALWLTASQSATVEASTVRHHGRRLRDGEVEDFALAQLDLDGRVTARIACSWFLPAGRDAVIEFTVYGTDGAAAVRNVGGSFYDLEAWRYRGTAGELLAEPPDEWGGRALSGWAERLVLDASYDPSADELVRLAEVLDAIYGHRR
jgi:predicted dehydrogenase